MEGVVTAFMLFIGTVSAASVTMPQPYDTIVIGLGSAGTTAASTLARAGKRVLALEAMDRIGGRVNTVPFGDGIVEVGAEWIHGTEGSRVYNLAVENNITLIPQSFVFEAYRSDGSRYDSPLFLELVEFCMNVQNSPPDEPEPLGTFITRKLKDYLKEKHPEVLEDREFLQQFLRAMNLIINNNESSNDWNDVSAFSNFAELEGDQYTSWHRHGYRTFFDLLLNKYNNGPGLPNLDIKLNTEVTKISWSRDPSESVKVTCADGAVYTANNVIVTVSLGVLKERHTSLFSPALSEKKATAIDKISVGVVAKIILLFPNPMWFANGTAPAFLWYEDELNAVPEEDRWFTRIVDTSPSMGNSNSMTLWCTGESAKRVTIHLFIVLITILARSESANILYVVPFTSKSHYIMLRPIGLELARRGHNVTAITANREKQHPPNYHQVMVDNKEIWNVIGGKRPNVFTMVDVSAEEFHDMILWRGGSGFTEVMLNSSEVQDFLAKDHKFDIVVAEQFFQEATYIFAHKYQTPLVLVTTFGNCMRHNIVTRNPLQIETVIQEFLDVKDPTSFWGRLRNFYFTIYEFFWWKYWYLPKQEYLVKKYIRDLPQPVPSLYEMQKNVSLILTNSHFSFDSPAAYLPNVVEIGGLHLTKADGELPKDLKTILDDSKNGVVYINFGSNVRSSELPIEKRNAFLNVFRRLKQTVIWKWEDDKMENQPRNLVIRNWLPQKEVLSHPNIKVFISHGGLIGTQEAIFHGVPIVGIPIYADQYNNLLQAQNIGFGKILQFNDITEQNLDRTLSEVLNNVTYKIKAKEMSIRFKDRPMTALDTAMYWIEYVIRNKGADYIKSPALELSWIAYTMLDIYLFILATVLVVLYVILKLVNYLIKLRRTSFGMEKTKQH